MYNLPAPAYVMQPKPPARVAVGPMSILGVVQRTRVRDVIRAQPITAALVVFALGYLFGRLGSLIPTGGSTRRS
jgi:hypothetical protein